MLSLCFFQFHSAFLYSLLCCLILLLIQEVLSTTGIALDVYGAEKSRVDVHKLLKRLICSLILRKCGGELARPIHLWARDRTREKIKSRVCPHLCVGPETCCTRLKDLQMLKKSVANGFEISIWMLKSPIIMALSNLSTRGDNWSENSVRKPLLELEFGGRQIIIQQMGSLWTILKAEISELLKEPRLSGILVKCFLKTTAVPPPLPVLVNWVGRAHMEPWKSGLLGPWW